jgi:hypothetical protein
MKVGPAAVMVRSETRAAGDPSPSHGSETDPAKPSQLELGALLCEHIAFFRDDIIDRVPGWISRVPDIVHGCCLGQ